MGAAQHRPDGERRRRHGGRRHRHAGGRVHNAIINAVNSNVVVVFAAGNDNSNIDVTPQFPAVYPEVMAVAATDPNDRKASFSNFGQAVDVSAPG